MRPRRRSRAADRGGVISSPRLLSFATGPRPYPARTTTPVATCHGFAPFPRSVHIFAGGPGAALFACLKRACHLPRITPPAGTWAERDLQSTPGGGEKAEACTSVVKFVDQSRTEVWV